MFVKELETLKYAELQKLAKGAGIKANQKIDKLVKALKEYYIEHDDEDEQGRQKKDNAEPSTTLGGQKSSGDGAVKRNSKDKKMEKSDSVSTVQAVRKGMKDSSLTSSDEAASIVRTARGTPTLHRPVNNKSNSNPVSRRGTPSTPLSAKHMKTAVLGAVAQPSVKTVESTPDNKVNRKRRRTFELDEPTLSAQNTPSSDDQPDKRATRQRTSQTRTSTETMAADVPAAKRVRKGTYDKDSPSVPGNVDTTSKRLCTSGSPGTKAIIDSIDANQSSAERKAGLMSVLDKKVQNKVSVSPAQNLTSQPSQIPRFMAFLANKKNVETQKPVTPGNKDWTKIHEKEFSKFDSLDVYLEKKQQRIEKLTGSAKKAAAVKSPRLKAKISKPRPQAQMKPFVPTVVSTKNLSFNFTKTPASAIRKTPASAIRKTPSNQSVSKTPKTLGSVTSARKSVGITNRSTPFKFTGNSTTLNTTVTSQKKMFDLKASLAKPLTWKPHTGKLQPLDFNKPGSVVEQKPFQHTTETRPSRQAMASKTRPQQAKDARRVKQLDRRNNQKYMDMMRRRGLLA